MKAILLNDFGTVENFEMGEVDVPANPEGNVLVRIKATAFNPIDYQIRKGGIESKLLTSKILGRELSGVVEVAGKSVNGLKEGDEVFAYVGSLGSNGTYTEYISIPHQLVASKPKNISFEEAAGIPMVGLTALQCFERLNPPKKEYIFISGGSGGVGTMLIKLFIAHGFEKLVTTAGNENSKRHLMGLGVKEENILSYKDADLTEKLLKINGGKPYNYCIDLVGYSMSDICSEIMNINGTYADITYLASKDSRELLFDKGCIILNISNYAYALSGRTDDYMYYGEKLQYLTRLIEDEVITCAPIKVVGGLSVNTVQEAHRLLESNGAGGRKLVMVFSPE